MEKKDHGRWVGAWDTGSCQLNLMPGIYVMEEEDEMPKVVPGNGPTWDVCIEALPSGSRELSRRGGGKTGRAKWMEDGRETMSSPHNKAGAHVNSQRLYQLTWPAQVQTIWCCSTARGKWTWTPTTNAKTMTNRQLLTKKTIRDFPPSVESHWIYSSHLRAGAMPSRWPTQNKLWYFWKCLWSHLVLSGHFSPYWSFACMRWLPILCFCGVCLYGCVCLCMYMFLMVFLCF